MVKGSWSQVFECGIYYTPMFGILGSQIEIKHIFIIVGVLTSIRRCTLEVENIDKLVIVLNNWTFDVCMEFDKKGGSFDDFLNEKATLIEDNVAWC
jgi:hypothetical protein